MSLIQRHLRTVPERMAGEKYRDWLERIDRHLCSVREATLEALPNARRKTCVECGDTFLCYVYGTRAERCCPCQRRKRREYMRSRYGVGRVKPGYPKIGFRFRTTFEVAAYVTEEKVECLLCGFSFRALAPHLARIHAVTAREYKEAVDLPLGVGLTGIETHRLQSAVGHQRIEEMKAAGVYDDQVAALIAGRRAGTIAPDRMSRVFHDDHVRSGKAAAASPNHPSKRFSTTKKVRVPCVGCGTIVLRTEMGAVTSRCQIKCRDCRHKVWLAWGERNPERRREIDQKASRKHCAKMKVAAKLKREQQR